LKVVVFVTSTTLELLLNAYTCGKKM